MSIIVRTLDRDDAQILSEVDPDVFDGPLRDDLIREFLEDPRHHIAVAIDEKATVVGMASAFHYVHPDKPPQFFINEVGVAGSYLRKGIGLRLMKELLAHGARLGCFEAWVATEDDNAAARALFVKVGGRLAPEQIVMYTFTLSAEEGEGGADPENGGLTTCSS